MRRLVATASGVLANFGGINLTFMFIATLGLDGALTLWLNAVHLNPWNYGFNLYSFFGVVIVYMYFQIPLMVLVITPALGGLRASWREAAENLGRLELRLLAHRRPPGPASPRFSERRCSCSEAPLPPMPLPTPSPQVPSPWRRYRSASFLNGNVISGEEHVGYAIGFGMLIVLSIVMVLYGLVRKRASRWLR